ncbi:NADPH-dependent FMN reductase [Pseudorhodoferax soli]|uniref:Chromate reductase n=1 Tax=Pseudorhodoferax soli TaxID=545864 RepID=A0A368XW91_9BURK|nr:NADPH-dependent FMN reductase [Pseudorhodoferax soli]RCW71729.1 chromate reductase [Pseudorhodoferax soli]
MKNLDVVALCGSLRSASLNRRAIRLAQEVMPSHMAIEELDWRAVPILDADALAHGYPAPVAALRTRIRAADAVLIATPEYNFSIPGGLKNLIDWLSRGEDQPFDGKPVAIVSASPGPLGGARVQYDLRKVLLFVNAMPLVKPEVFIGGATAKFDAETGACTDATTRDFVTKQMAAFAGWIAAVQRMQGSTAPARP